MSPFWNHTLKIDFKEIWNMLIIRWFCFYFLVASIVMHFTLGSLVFLIYKMHHFEEIEDYVNPDFLPVFISTNTSISTLTMKCFGMLRNLLTFEWKLRLSKWAVTCFSCHSYKSKTKLGRKLARRNYTSNLVLNTNKGFFSFNCMSLKLYM